MYLAASLLKKTKMICVVVQIFVDVYSKQGI